MRTPSYVSCEWALNRHGVLLQSPTVCTVLTLETSVGASRNVRFGNVTIEFSKIAPRLFTGYEGKDGYKAIPEKALLDTVHLRKKIPFQDELDWDAINKEKLARMAESFPAMVKKQLEEIMK